MSVGRSSLQVTYRKGRFVAAYHDLPGTAGRKVHVSREVGDGLVADFDEEGRPVGIEILTSEAAGLQTFNPVLAELGCGGVTAEELGPLAEAA